MSTAVCAQRPHQYPHPWRARRRDSSVPMSTATTAQPAGQLNPTTAQTVLSTAKTRSAR